MHSRKPLIAGSVGYGLGVYQALCLVPVHAILADWKAALGNKGKYKLMHSARLSLLTWDGKQKPALCQRIQH